MNNITKLLLAATVCGAALFAFCFISGNTGMVSLTGAVSCSVVFLIAFSSSLFIKNKKNWEDVLAVLLALVALPCAIISWSFKAESMKAAEVSAVAIERVA